MQQALQISRYDVWNLEVSSVPFELILFIPPPTKYCVPHSFWKVQATPPLVEKDRK
jgi:hypothetical protein